MATSNTSYGFRMPAAYPANQTFGGPTGGIFTDTETQPSVSDSVRYHDVIRRELTRQNIGKARTISVQTKVFRTDQDNGAADFSSCYTSVTEDKL